MEARTDVAGESKEISSFKTKSETLNDLEFGSKIAKVLTESELNPTKIF